MKKELQADAELDWNASLEWISGQTKLEMFERDNDIDDNNTSKQNNDVSDNNEGGTQNMSEEKDRVKGFDNSSSSDDDEDNNQNDDNGTTPIKRKLKVVFGKSNQMKKMNGMNKEALTGISTEMTKHKMKVKKLCQ
jgi:hypothetical protein